MKHIALATLFAAALAAQQEPHVGLATAIAAEEQERNLPKAVRLYREALGADELDQSARRFATDRLAELLRRLGRVDEANALRPDGARQGQDKEREKQLRLKARELVKQIVEAGGSNIGGPIVFAGMSAQQAEQLMWIGQPAVPELVLGVQEMRDAAPGKRSTQVLNGLLQILWRLRGPQASEFLVACANAEDMGLRYAAAEAAAYATEIDVDAPEFRAFLDHEDWGAATRVLEGWHSGPGASPGIIKRLTADQLLAMAARGRNEMKAVVLQNLGGQQVSPLSAEQLEQAHALVKQAFDGTDPKMGRAAERFICSSASQQTVQGMLWVIGRLPSLHERNVSIAPFRSSRGPRPQNANPYQNIELQPAEIEVLVSALDGPVQAIGSPESRTGAVNWVEQLMIQIAAQGDEQALAHAIRWWREGYRLGPVMQTRVSKQNAADLLRCADLFLRDHKGSGWLHYFHAGLMSPETYEPLVLLLEHEILSRQRAGVLELMAATGDARAIDHLLDAWRGKDRSESVTSKNGATLRIGDAMARALVLLGRNNRSAKVRQAMVQVLRGDGGPAPSGNELSELQLALMSMGDERALDFLVDVSPSSATRHPYQDENDRRNTRPWSYLLDAEPEPAHGYSREQVLRTIARRAAKEGNQVQDPRYVAKSGIPDAVLVALADTDRRTYKDTSWRKVALERLDRRIADGGDIALLEEWFLRTVGATGSSRRWFESNFEHVIRRYADRMRELVDGEDEYWAYQAMRSLRQVGKPVAIADLLRSRHGKLRWWALNRVVNNGADADPAQVLTMLDDPSPGTRELAARQLGALVEKEAVPTLIARLRDPEEVVRKAAAEALTRIRFYHEQQAHWDRVLKGLDASPGSAAEKLLLQAKPGEDVEQRVLAIKSLGVLGMPEALPFLIDWSRDADASVQQAAKAAITAIHLKPRK